MPHVESRLTFDYDVAGRFSSPVITGAAAFADSEFLGARVLAGTSGSIDTSARPLRYAGEGPVVGIDLPRFARELDIGWLRDPRYAGTVSGRFRVDGVGTDAATMWLSGGGRLTRAEVFDGALADADVSVEIADGSLRASYDGRLEHINPKIAFQDERFSASLTGTGTGRVSIPDLLVREVGIDDYSIDADLVLQESSVRDDSVRFPRRIGGHGRRHTHDQAARCRRRDDLGQRVGHDRVRGRPSGQSCRPHHRADLVRLGADHGHRGRRRNRHDRHGVRNP